MGWSDLSLPFSRKCLPISLFPFCDLLMIMRAIWILSEAELQQISSVVDRQAPVIRESHRSERDLCAEQPSNSRLRTAQQELRRLSGPTSPAGQLIIAVFLLRDQ